MRTGRFNQYSGESVRYTRFRRQVGRYPAAMIGALAMLFFYVCLTPAAAEERRVALVIGNGAYAQTPLRNTINDARAMTETLENLGFKVIMRLNATQKEMISAIYQFGDELDKGAVGLFYYAGHAVQIRGKNFMIPVGARISVVEHVEPESVDLNRVLGRMGGARNRLNIVILDACRDNPFGESFRYYTEGLAQTRAPANSFIAYAAAPGELAADGTGVNSFYTGALVKAMTVPGLTLEETFKKVSTEVRKATKGFQVPWTSSSFNENFYFKPPAANAKGDDNETRGRAIDREVAFWQSIFETDKPEYFEAYLLHFPDGLFTTPAQIKLLELQRSGRRKRAADRDPDLGKGLLAVIDKSFEKGKSDGADYILQFEAAVRSGKTFLQRREAMKRQAESAQKQVLKAGKEKAEKRYREELANAERDAAAAERRIIVEATKKAEAERKKAIDTATSRYAKAANLALAKAKMEAEKREQEALATAKTQAAENRQIEFAAAKKNAADEYRQSMAEAEAAAEKIRQRMIAVAKEKADKALRRQLSQAKRAADENERALLARLQEDARNRKARELAAAKERNSADVTTAIETIKRKAAKEYESVVALARETAKQKRAQILADARTAAEAERQAQVEKLSPKISAGPVTGGAQSGKAKAAEKQAVLTPKNPANKKGSLEDEGNPCMKELGLEENVPEELKRAIRKAMQGTAKRGEGCKGQVLAALRAIKIYRDAHPSAPKAPLFGNKSKPQQEGLMGLANANPEYKDVIETAMTRARADGKSFDEQVRAALDAVKRYRDTEIKTKQQ